MNSVKSYSRGIIEKSLGHRKHFWGQGRVAGSNIFDLVDTLWWSSLEFSKSHDLCKRGCIHGIQIVTRGLRHLFSRIWRHQQGRGNKGCTREFQFAYVSKQNWHVSCLHRNLKSRCSPTTHPDDVNFGKMPIRGNVCGTWKIFNPVTPGPKSELPRPSLSPPPFFPDGTVHSGTSKKYVENVNNVNEIMEK